jgi:hypothetical protein
LKQSSFPEMSQAQGPKSPTPGCSAQNDSKIFSRAENCNTNPRQSFVTESERPANIPGNMERPRSKTPSQKRQIQQAKERTFFLGGSLWCAGVFGAYKVGLDGPQKIGSRSSERLVLLRKSTLNSLRPQVSDFEVVVRAAGIDSTPQFSRLRAFDYQSRGQTIRNFLQPRGATLWYPIRARSERFGGRGSLRAPGHHSRSTPRTLSTE